MNQVQVLKAALLGLDDQGDGPQHTVAQSMLDDDLDDDARAMAAAYEHAMSAGSVSPLIKGMGMGGIANLLRGLSPRTRGHGVRMLFSRNPDNVRAALRAIATEHHQVGEGSR